MYMHEAGLEIGTGGAETAAAKTKEVPIWQDTPRMREVLSAIEESKRDLTLYQELVREAGYDPAQVTDRKVFARMAFLDAVTPTVQDEKKCIEYAHTVARYLKEQGAALSEEELRTITLGTLFTDIGKTGPAEATPEQEMLVTAMYTIRADYNPETVSVAEFLRQHFPANAEDKIRIFEQMSFRGEPLKSTDTMRQFYNLHVHWSYDLTIGSGLPKEAVFAAATHHVVEGQNPHDILSPEGVFTDLNEPRKIDRREVLVVLLDKYDAQISRSGVTHAKAIEWLENFINTDGKYGKRDVIDRTPGLLAEFNAGIEILRSALHPTRRDSVPVEVH